MLKRSSNNDDNNGEEESSSQEPVGSTPKKVKAYQPSPLRQSWTAPLSLRSPSTNLGALFTASPDTSQEFQSDQENLTSPSYSRRDRRKSSLRELDESKQPDDRRKSTGRRVSFAPRARVRPYAVNDPVKSPISSPVNDASKLRSPTLSDYEMSQDLSSKPAGGLFEIPNLMSTGHQLAEDPFELRLSLGVPSDAETSGHTSFDVDLPLDSSASFENNRRSARNVLQPDIKDDDKEFEEHQINMALAPAADDSSILSDDRSVSIQHSHVNRDEFSKNTTTSNAQLSQLLIVQTTTNTNQMETNKNDIDIPVLMTTPRRHSYSLRNMGYAQSPALTEYGYADMSMTTVQDFSIIHGAMSEVDSDSMSINFIGDTTRQLMNESPLQMDSPSTSLLASQSDTPLPGHTASRIVRPSPMPIYKPIINSPASSINSENLSNEQNENISINSQLPSFSPSASLPVKQKEFDTDPLMTASQLSNISASPSPAVHTAHSPLVPQTYVEPMAPGDITQYLMSLPAASKSHSLQLSPADDAIISSHIQSLRHSPTSIRGSSRPSLQAIQKSNTPSRDDSVTEDDNPFAPVADVPSLTLQRSNSADTSMEIGSSSDTQEQHQLIPETTPRKNHHQTSPLVAADIESGSVVTTPRSKMPDFSALRSPRYVESPKFVEFNAPVQYTGPTQRSLISLQALKTPTQDIMAKLQSLQSQSQSNQTLMSRSRLSFSQASQPLVPSTVTGGLDVSPLRRQLVSLTPLRNPARHTQASTNRRHTIAPSFLDQPLSYSLAPLTIKSPIALRASMLQATPLRRSSGIFDELASETSSPQREIVPHHMTLKEFLELVDVRFVDLLTSLRHKKPDTAAIMLSQSNDDVKTAAVHYTSLELYSFACRELSCQIKQQLELMQAAEKKVNESNPAFFALFQRSDKLEQHLLKEQVKCTQLNGRLSAKQDWYLWYQNLLRPAQSAFEDSKNKLEEDKARLIEYQNQQQEFLAIRNFMHDQAQSLQRSKERATARAEEDIQRLKRLVSETEQTSRDEDQARITLEERKQKLTQLKEKLSNLHDRRNTLQIDIKHYETICSTSTFYTVKDLERIQEPLTALTALTGIEIALTGPTSVVLTYRSELKFLIEYRREKGVVKSITILRKSIIPLMFKYASSALLSSLKSVETPTQAVRTALQKWEQLRQLMSDFDYIAKRFVTVVQDRKRGELSVAVQFFRYPDEKLDVVFDLNAGYRRTLKPQDVSIKHYCGPNRRHYDGKSLAVKDLCLDVSRMMDIQRLIVVK